MNNSMEGGKKNGLKLSKPMLVLGTTAALMLGGSNIANAQTVTQDKPMNPVTNEKQSELEQYLAQMKMIQQIPFEQKMQKLSELFLDAKDIKAWAVDYFYYAVISKQLFSITGVRLPNGEFNQTQTGRTMLYPNAPATLSQVVKLMSQLGSNIELILGLSNKVDGMKAAMDVTNTAREDLSNKQEQLLTHLEDLEAQVKTGKMTQKEFEDQIKRELKLTADNFVSVRVAIADALELLKKGEGSLLTLQTTLMDRIAIIEGRLDVIDKKLWEPIIDAKGFMVGMQNSKTGEKVMIEFPPKTETAKPADNAATPKPEQAPAPKPTFRLDTVSVETIQAIGCLGVIKPDGTYDLKPSANSVFGYLATNTEGKEIGEMYSYTAYSEKSHKNLQFFCTKTYDQVEGITGEQGFTYKFTTTEGTFRFGDQTKDGVWCEFKALPSIFDQVQYFYRPIANEKGEIISSNGCKLTVMPAATPVTLNNPK
jgi:hypothetical protein